MSDWKPNLFIPGFPKCGTTALAAYLDQHKDIYLIDGKEPGTLYHWKKVAGFMIPNKENPHIGSPVNESLYKKMFSEHKDAKYRVDASQPYSFDVDFVNTLKEFNPKSKIILSIRNQISRVYVAYGFTYPFHHMEFYDWIDKYIRKEMDYFLFSPYLKKTFEVFGKENVLVLEQERLLESPQKVMDKVFDWLGLESIKIKSIMINVNAISPFEKGFSKELKSAVMNAVSLLTKPIKYAVYTTGLHNSKAFLKLRKHHPIIYTQNLLGRLGGERMHDNLPIPEDISSILLKDYEEAKNFVNI